MARAWEGNHVDANPTESCAAKARWFCIQPPVVPLEGRVVPRPERPEPLSYDPPFDSCSKIEEACGPQFLHYTRLLMYHSIYICIVSQRVITMYL